MNPLLQARSLVHARGAERLFDALELAVADGDRVGLVGHNGSGKTTLLRLLSGALEPDGGEIVRRRGLATAFVEQFLPDALAGRTLRDAVAQELPPDEVWRAEAQLSLLGFAEADFDTPAGSFSGGQQNRLMLARALVVEPELLLLDEPTNHLDLDTLLVFERVLGAFPGALVLVSHDRDFLDAMTTTTWVLRDRRIYRFSAPYSEATALLEAADEAKARARESEERRIDSLRRSARRLATWGRVYDNEKLARRAQSMERRVERLEAEKTFVTEGSPLDVSLALGASRARQALVVEDMAVSVPARVLYRIRELVIRPGERVALLGANGTGKTTLIRALMTAYRERRETGPIRFGPQSVVGYYDQDLDEVAGEEAMLAFACRRVSASEAEVRVRLIRAGFPHAAHGKRVRELSGGERARLLFVVLALERPNFLVLDEPTNHIDIAGREQLEAELDGSEATLLITSHDRRFLRRLANRYLWIRDGELAEVMDPETVYEAAAAAAGAIAEPTAASAAEPMAAAGDGGETAEQILEEIVALEALLHDDEARKPKFQKPDLQAGWRRELERLYERLERLEKSRSK